MHRLVNAIPEGPLTLSIYQQNFKIPSPGRAAGKNHVFYNFVALMPSESPHFHVA